MDFLCSWQSREIIQTDALSSDRGCRRLFQAQLLFPVFPSSHEKSVFAEAD